MTSKNSPDGSDTEGRSIPAVERAIGLALTLPFEVGVRIVELAPSGIEKVRQQVVLARFIGKLAVDRGAREVRHRLTGEGYSDTSPTTSSDRTEPEITASNEPESDDLDDSPLEESLALPDYDQLPAAHVVAKLAGLNDDERDAIEIYETNGRHRRTILGKLTQLRSGEVGE